MRRWGDCLVVRASIAVRRMAIIPILSDPLNFANCHRYEVRPVWLCWTHDCTILKPQRPRLIELLRDTVDAVRCIWQIPYEGFALIKTLLDTNLCPFVVETDNVSVYPRSPRAKGYNQYQLTNGSLLEHILGLRSADYSLCTCRPYIRRYSTSYR